MSQPILPQRHIKLWLVGSTGFIWNAMGVLNLAMQMNTSTLASMPVEQRAIIDGRPAWATAAFAVGVIAGLVGCLLLLLRKPAAFPVLCASLAAIALHMLSYLGMPRIFSDLGAWGVVLFVVLPLAVAVFLVWFARMRRTA